jgi:hypothetical protein
MNAEKAAVQVPEGRLIIAQRFNDVSTLGAEFRRARVPKERLNWSIAPIALIGAAVSRHTA